MVTIGEGATAQVQADIQKLGTNLLQVFRGQGFGGPGGARSTAPPFTLEDAAAIEREVAGARAVAPAANTFTQVIYGNANWSTQVTGTTDSYLDVRDWPLAGGRNFSESELRAGAAVCLLGDTVRQELFADQDPLGTSIRLQKVSCQVISVLSPKGQSGFGQNQDDIVVVPLRMLQRRMAGNSDVNSIMVSARAGVPTERVQAEIETLLRERRRLRSGADDDFVVRDPAGQHYGVLTSIFSGSQLKLLAPWAVGLPNAHLVQHVRDFSEPTRADPAPSVVAWLRRHEGRIAVDP